MEYGHYVIPIPWKRIQDGVRKPLAENNKVLALNRYASLRKRLVKDPELKAKYASGIQNMIGKGYAEEIPPEESIEMMSRFIIYLTIQSLTQTRRK